MYLAERSTFCDKFVQLSKDEQLKNLRDVGFEDVSCKQILAAVPSDFPLLKGADYIVVEGAKSLGLPVCVKPFLSHDYAEDQYVLKHFSNTFPEKDLTHIDYCEPIICLQVFGDGVYKCKSQDITWCQKLVYHQPAAAVLAPALSTIVLI